MRKSIAATLLLAIISMTWYACKTSRSYKPIRLDEKSDKENLLPEYKPNEILVFYKNGPSPSQQTTIKRAVKESGVDTAALTIRRCNDCDPYVELWQGANIHTVISGGGGIRGGSGGKTNGVGEDSIAYYSVNYVNEIPEANPRLQTPKPEPTQIQPPATGTGKDTITIAILDTGIDTAQYVSGATLWVNADKNDGADEDSNCYKDDTNGWNFIAGNNNIKDDNNGIHGSIIAQYIVNEFSHSTKNFVQLMVLKTHDGAGRGDLFSSLCAINYAANKGANIINASWGFYYYYDSPHPILSDIITTSLASKGILFLAAAGNKTVESDNMARTIYQQLNPGVVFPKNLLRNLEFHSFYPAVLSKPGTNVITVTTNNLDTVSNTQNYSSEYVDLGVFADSVSTSVGMAFRMPFQGNPNRLVRGSSFATAIASGKIGAFLDKSAYIPGMNKSNCFSSLSSIINTSNPLQTKKLIADGRFMKRE